MLNLSSLSASRNFFLCSSKFLVPDGLISIHRLSTAPKSVTISDEYSSAKPFSSIPGPKGLPFVGNVLALPKYMRTENTNDLIEQHFAKYGPIYKERIGYLNMVYTCDIETVEKLLRHEGKYPRRIIVPCWRYWRDEQGLARGVITEDGPNWKRMRTLLDKQMLPPRIIATYTDRINEVVTDLIAQIKTILRSDGSGKTVPNLDHQLFLWSLETIGTIIYERRFGNLSDDRLPEIDGFIASVQNMFTSTEKIVYLPTKLNRIFFRKWQKIHDESWKTIFRTTENFINEKLTEIQKKAEGGEEVSGFLSYLLASNMPEQEIYSNISEIMLAAVDTTSNTMQWVLYEMSRRPDLQEKVHAEVTKVVPSGSIPSYDDLQQMPLLKAVVKEILRLYPVANITSRIVNDDTVLCGYQIPANTTVMGSSYIMGRDPKIFSDPLAFKPERWLRTDNAEAIHNFAWLPFGFGIRACVGRRVAELEMHLLLARISMLFELKFSDDELPRPMTRSLLIPHKPVKVEFIERNQ